jgi:hypothetical protein
LYVITLEKLARGLSGLVAAPGMCYTRFDHEHLLDEKKQCEDDEDPQLQTQSQRPYFRYSCSECGHRGTTKVGLTNKRTWQGPKADLFVPSANAGAPSPSIGVAPTYTNARSVIAQCF